MMAAAPTLFQLRSDNGFTFETSTMPQGFRISKAANFNPNDIIGRSSPIITYSNSGSMFVDAVFELHAVGGSGSMPSDIADVIKSFLSLVFPVSPGIKPPAKCHITAMGVLDNWECVCSNVDPNVGDIVGYDQQGNPMHSSVACKFIGLEIQNVSADTWLAAGNYKQLAFTGNGGG